MLLAISATHTPVRLGSQKPRATSRLSLSDQDAKDKLIPPDRRLNNVNEG